MSDQALENFKTGEHTREQPRRNLPISAHSSNASGVIVGAHADSADVIHGYI
jgi:hypothetical protein